MEPLSTVLDELRGTLARLLHAEGCIRLVSLAAALPAALLARPTLPDAWLAAWLGLLVLLFTLHVRHASRAPVAILEGLAWGGGAAALLVEGGTAPAAACLLALVAAALWHALAPATTVGRHAAFLVALTAPPLAVLESAWSPALLPVALLLALCLLGSLALAWQNAVREATSEGRESTLKFALAARESELVRLRLDMGAAGATRAKLEDALATANQELSVLRTKTSSLSSMLQRVNPYDIETGLLNEEKFSAVLQREWSRMQRQEMPLSLLLVSVDAFDAFLDWHGKVAFEAVLRRLGDTFRQAGSRPGDVAARLQTNLFALLFTETDFRYVGPLADSIRRRVRELGIAAAPTESRKTLTVTIGTATVIPNGDLAPSQLMERVEAALFEAQFQGGDRSVSYRTFDRIRVEPWNPHGEGELGVEPLRHKLAVLGFDAEPRVLRPGEALPACRLPAESVLAVAAGRLEVLLDGEPRTLRAGDLMLIPKGTTIAAEAGEKQPAVCFHAMRAQVASEPSVA